VDKLSTKDIKSWIALPLEFGGDPIGIITLDKLDIRTEGSVDLTQLSRYLSTAATGIEKLLRERNLGIVDKILEKVSTEPELFTLLNEIVKILKEGLNCECAFFQRVENIEKVEIIPWPFNWKDSSKQAEKGFEEGVGIAGKVLKTGHSIIIGDTGDPHYDYLSRSGDSRQSMLVVPINVSIKGNPNPRTIALISADKEEICGFNHYDRDLLELVSKHVATLIDRTMILELLSQTIKSVQNQAYSEVSKKVDVNQKTADYANETLREIVRQAIKLTNAHSGIIHLMRRLENGTYKLVGSFSSDTILESVKPRDNGLTQKVIEFREGETKVFSKKDLKPELIGLRIEACIGVPLRDEKEAVGVLFLNSHRADKVDFNEIERYSLKMFASHAVLAIRTAQKQLEEKRRSNIFSRLSELAEFMAKEETTNVDILNKMARDIYQVITDRDKGENAIFVHIMLKKDDVLEPQAVYPPQLMDSLKSFLTKNFGEPHIKLTHLNPGLAGEVAKTGKPRKVPDVKTLKGSPYLELRDDTKSELAVPIKDEGNQVIGVINLEHSEYDVFTEDDLENVKLFASQAAIILHQLEVYEKNRRERKQLLGFSDSLRNLALVQDAEAVLRRLVYNTKEKTEAVWVSVIPFRKDSAGKYNVLKAFSSDPYPYVDAKAIVRDNEDVSISRQVFNSDKHIYFEDIDREPEGKVNPFITKENKNIKAAICIPLTLQQKKFGVMWIHYDKPRKFSVDEIEILKLYAGQAATIYDFVTRSFGDINESLAANLQEDYKDTKKQASWLFRLSFGVMIAGVILIGLGVFRVVNNEITTTALLAILGIVTDTASLLVFQQAQLAYKRADKYHGERLQIKQLENLLIAANQLPDEQRENLKDTIIRQTSTEWFSSKKEPTKSVEQTTKNKKKL